MAEIQRKNDEVGDLPCLYVSEWNCPIQTQDLPLEICQLCLQARRLNMELKNTRLQTPSSTLTPQLSSRTPIQSLTRVRGELERVKKDLKEAREGSTERLKTISDDYKKIRQLVEELERERGVKTPAVPISFERERVQTTEYEGKGIPKRELEELKDNLSRVREELMERLKTLSDDYERLYQLISERKRGIETPTSTPFEPRVEEREFPVALLHLKWDPDSGPSTEARYPEDWSWKGRITKEMLSALYAITLMSGKEAVGMCLKFKNSKVASIARRNDNLLLLVMEPDQDFKDYNEEIKRMAGEVEVLRDWEGILPYLFKKYLSRLATT